MPSKRREPTAEDLRKAEKEIGENIPHAALGREDGDVRDVKLDEEETQHARRGKTTREPGSYDLEGSED